mgnify:CR=1 FL=1
MTPDTLRLYKLIILYALSRTKQGLPNAFLCDFILGHGYTDFFSIQETLALLTEDALIEEEATDHTKGISDVRILLFRASQRHDTTD